LHVPVRHIPKVARVQMRVQLKPKVERRDITGVGIAIKIRIHLHAKTEKAGRDDSIRPNGEVGSGFRHN
jgi:hypothetical protein